MSTELATTQPVRRPGTPAPLGGAALPPDKLGLTLRERLWLTRAALTTIALSAIASTALLSYVPVQAPKHPADALANRLAEQAERPVLAPVHPVAESPEPLPAAEARRPVEPAPVVTPAPAAPVAATPQSKAEPVVVKGIAPQKGVQIIRNSKSKEVAPWPVLQEAVRLDVPQPLAPKKVEYVDHPKPAATKPPAPAPEPADDGDLKRPSFE